MNVYIKVTETCNLACDHCYNPYLAKEVDYSSVQSFLQRLQDILPTNYFILHGGEPMLASMQNILFLIQKFPKAIWRISTNLCYPLTQERILVLDKMQEIRVSFDVKIRYKTIRNLLLWKRNIITLSKRNAPLFLNICLTKYLLKHHPRQLLKMMRRFNIKQFSLERITQKGNALAHMDIIPSYIDVNRWLCLLYTELKQYPEIQCIDIESIRSSIANDRHSCYGKECCCQALTINADGTIGNCPNNARENIIGNTESDVKDILKAIVSKKHMPRRACLTCEYYKYCRGFCEQMEWQDTICPYPKQLTDIILRDEHRT